MLNFIIFSKDRACQLQLLLESLEKNFKEFNNIQTNILYTYSNINFKVGYERLQKKYSNVNFILQNNFKKDLYNLIDDNLYTIFGVDDNIMINPFSLDCKELDFFNKNNNIHALSLRLDKYKTFCFTENKKYNLPKFLRNDFEMWDWTKQISPGILYNGDWAYPFSLDFNIYKTKDIKELLYKLNYFSPNTLEGQLSINTLKSKPFMLCFDNAKIINFAVNKVQTDCNNRCGKIDSNYLNEMFLNGYKIDLNSIRNIEYESCHIDNIEFKFIKI